MNIEILEILLYFPTLILGLLILLIPFLISKRIKIKYQNKLFKILHLSVVCLFFAGIITFIFTYWSVEVSSEILLKKMNYNENGMDEYEYYQNVNPEFLQKAKALKQNQMGIGWPLKATFMFVFFTLPYEIIMSLILGIRKEKDYS